MKKTLMIITTFIMLFIMASCGNDAKADLMISVYLEGSSNNKSIEIYNNSDKDVSLNNYYIAIYKTNEEVINTKVALNGTIKKKDVYVISNDKANDDILSKTNLKTSDLNFVGSQGIALMYKDEIIDVIGALGVRNQNADITYVRKTYVLNAKTTFNQYDWLIYAKDNSNYLGKFINSVTEEELLKGPQFDLKYLDKDFTYITGTKYMGTGGAVEVTLESNIDGDTSYFIFPDEIDISSIVSIGNYYVTSSGKVAAKVRYQDTDTPETYSGNIQEWGWPAKLNTANLQNNAKKIYVQTVANDSLTGTYGRLLGYVFVVNADGSSKCVNFDTIAKGYSNIGFQMNENMTYKDLPYYSYFLNAQLRAKELKLGLYGAKDPEWDYVNNKSKHA